MTTLFDSATCVRALLDDFRRYDQAVDIVSAWECFFTRTEIRKSLQFFDRFPKLKVPGQSQEYTPEFAACFGQSYGLLGEVKRTFPRGDQQFDKELRQLQNYDQPLLFKRDQDETVVPSHHDILLIVSLEDSHAILRRIQERIEDGGHSFKLQHSNLILVEYHYDSLVTEPRYVFRKVAEQSSDFRDNALPPEHRLSALLTQNRQSIKVPPERLQEIKATWIFCNDDPPPIFTVVFLWTKVFYDLLSEQQKQQWRTADPRKVLEIKTGIPEIRHVVTTKYVARGSWTRWIKEAIDALAEAGMARYVNNNDCYVGYRNLSGELRLPGVVRTPDEPRIDDTARILATYICRGRLQSHPKTTEAPPGQQTMEFEKSKKEAAPPSTGGGNEK